MSVRVAIARHGDQAVNEIGGVDGAGIGIGSPAQLIWRRGHFVKGSAAQSSLSDRLKRLVRHRRPHAIKPCPAVDHSRRCEWRAAQLLGIQSMRHFLGRILPAGQRAFHRLARELVAKA